MIIVTLLFFFLLGVVWGLGISDLLLDKRETGDGKRVNLLPRFPVPRPRS
jgi:hypothetical protein